MTKPGQSDLMQEAAGHAGQETSKFAKEIIEAAIAGFEGQKLPIGIGMALGVSGAIALSRILRSFLYEESPFEPAIFLTVH